MVPSNTEKTTAVQRQEELHRELPHLAGKTAVSYSPLRRGLITLWEDRVAMLGLAGVLLLILMSIFAPLLAPHDPVKMFFDSIMSPPSAAHPFGTDDLGRDILSRVLYGGR